MNGSLAENIRRKLAPALEQSQGFEAVYSSGAISKGLKVIPTAPDWVSEDDHGTVIEEWEALVFEVFSDTWHRTGFAVPKQNDRIRVTLADGVPRVFAVLAPKGMQVYSLSADSGNLFIRTKRVKA